MKDRFCEICEVLLIKKTRNRTYLNPNGYEEYEVNFKKRKTCGIKCGQLLAGKASAKAQKDKREETKRNEKILFASYNAFNFGRAM